MNRKNLGTALEFLDKLGSLMAEFEAELEIDTSHCYYVGDVANLAWRLFTSGEEWEREGLDLEFGTRDITIDDVLMQADQIRRRLEEGQ